MSDTSALPPDDLPPLVLPARTASRSERDRRDPPPPPPPRGGSGRGLMILFLLGSLGLNFLLIVILFFSMLMSGGGGADDGPPITERFHSGDAGAGDKVAVIRVESILMDEMMGYAQKQIDKAAKDPSVKAVVLRINSPGGTITASDDLHKRLKELKDGKSPRWKNGTPKPLVASMGAMAASGGYYIAVPAQHIFAEKTTITGSIGVYVSLPNVAELGDKYGVKMNLVKAGDMKASGSMFHELSPAERQQWQDMVDDSYTQFIKIVEDGRPHLKGALTKDLVRTDAFGHPLPDQTRQYDRKGDKLSGGDTVPYKRKLADGGIFTATDAKKYGLVDSIGYLEEATTEAAKVAGLSKYKVVMYDRPPSLLSLFGGGIKAPAVPDWSKLAAAATPRAWYMAPNSEFAGLLAAIGKE